MKKGARKEVIFLKKDSKSVFFHKKKDLKGRIFFKVLTFFFFFEGSKENLFSLLETNLAQEKAQLTRPGYTMILFRLLLKEINLYRVVTQCLRQKASLFQYF